MTQCDACVKADECEDSHRGEGCEEFEYSDERMLNEGE